MEIDAFVLGRFIIVSNNPLTPFVKGDKHACDFFHS